MNRKEMYYFLGRCLVLNDFPAFRPEVNDVLGTGKFPWELFVRFGSSHLVLPQVYRSLSEASMLHLLPGELEAFLAEIYGLNLERNTRIISQTRRINRVLSESGIRPVFLKGAAALMGNLYGNSAGRIMADIDCLVKTGQQRAKQLLLEEGYSVQKSGELFMKHQASLYKQGETDIDLHSEPVMPGFIRMMGGWEERVEPLPDKEGYPVWILSLPDRVMLNFLHNQLQDRGQYFANISLRSIFEIYMLLRMQDVSAGVREMTGRYRRHYNNYLAVVARLFHPFVPEGYIPNTFSRLFICRFNQNKKSRIYYRSSKITRTVLLQLFHYISVSIRAVFNRTYRHYLLSRLNDRSWYRHHLNTVQKRIR